MTKVFKEISEFQTRDELQGDEFVQVSSTERVSLKDQFGKKLDNAIEMSNEDAMKSLIESGQAKEGQIYYIVED